MALNAYRAKRNFASTPEPGGGSQAQASSPAPVYVIQKHRASHLHWDLRLQEGDVLKSWAVPKEPPSAPGIRRLAVEVEDHPLEYARFEGVIPEGSYGAGTVEIWDEGTYRSLETTPSKRVFELTGRRLRGPYALVKTAGEPEGRSWLFFKMKASPEQRP